LSTQSCYFKGFAVLVVAIVACEIGFWVLLALGLIVRYALRWPRTSVVLLASVPVVDLVLLVLTTMDLSRGNEPGVAHGLAAVYLGFSVVFGHSIIASVDAWVAHRFAGGPPPPRRSAVQADRLRHEWQEWGKAALASCIAAGLLLAAIAYVGDAADTTELWGWIQRLAIVLAAWLVLGPLWQAARPSRPKGRQGSAPDSVGAGSQ
jgi:hypothetical protein